MATRVLFVCLGNICRSPLAEGIARARLRERPVLSSGVEVDSAGTGSWHVGEAPHPRAREVAEANGVALDGQQARQVEAADFENFDLILAMDAENLNNLYEICPKEHGSKLGLFRGFDPEGGNDVPDPYYEGGFDRVFAIIDRTCEGLLDHLEQSSS